MDQSKDIAAFALKLVRSATAPTDDATQHNIAAVKNWLTQIIKGHLVVGEPVQEPKDAGPQPGKGE